MKYCSKCGKEIMEDAVICPYCGCQVGTVTAVNKSAEVNESSGLSTCAIVFAVLIPVVGLICGIVGTAKYKTQSYKNKCIAAIPISIVSWIVWAMILNNVL